MNVKKYDHTFETCYSDLERKFTAVKKKKKPQNYL